MGLKLRTGNNEPRQWGRRSRPCAIVPRAAYHNVAALPGEETSLALNPNSAITLILSLALALTLTPALALVLIIALYLGLALAYTCDLARLASSFRWRSCLPLHRPRRDHLTSHDTMMGSDVTSRRHNML